MHERLSRGCPASRLRTLSWIIVCAFAWVPARRVLSSGAVKRCAAVVWRPISSLQVSSAHKAGLRVNTFLAYLFVHPSLQPFGRDRDVSSRRAPLALRRSSADCDSALHASPYLPPLLSPSLSYCLSFLPFVRRVAIVSVFKVGETHGRSLPNREHQDTSPQPLHLTAPTTAHCRHTRQALNCTHGTLHRPHHSLCSHAAYQGGEKGAHAGETGLIRRRDHRCACRQGTPQH